MFVVVYIGFGHINHAKDLVGKIGRYYIYFAEKETMLKIIAFSFNDEVEVTGVIFINNAYCHLTVSVVLSI